MLIPTQIANKIKGLESDLFFYDSLPLKTKRIIFYRNIRPLLNWLFDRIQINYNLEPDEIESELYILSCKLFQNFDKSKSSIVPYLEKYIIFYAQKLETKLNRSILNQSTLVYENKFSYIDEEYYWKDNNILISDRFIGRYFTNYEKYIINIILNCEDNEITRVGLADKLNINVKTFDKLIDSLREKRSLIWH